VDWHAVHALNTLLVQHDGLEDVTVFYERLAEVLFLAVLAGLFCFGSPVLRRGAVAAGLSAGAALTVAYGIGVLVNRPRPFVAHAGRVHEFLPHVADAGFPSDHATAATAIAVALLLRHRAAGGALLIAALLLAVGRVALAIHYPTDVLAGAVVGATVAGALSVGRAGRAIDRVGDMLDALRAAFLERAPAPRI
jgi:undecaprenyl-diphosphatase